MEHLSHSVSETEALGEALAKHLSAGDVIAYLGDLGAGKTAFTRGLARGLGCTGRVTSPTFTIVNEYEGAIPLFHFDMYRLSDADELFDIGWDDYLNRGGICAVANTKCHEARLITVGAVAALCGALVCGIADYLWNYPRVMCIFWFLIALILAFFKKQAV